MREGCWTAAVIVGAVVGTAGTASGQAPPRVVLSTFDPATNSLVMPGGGSRTPSLFSDMTRSPDGKRWILIASLTGTTTPETTTNRVIIAGESAGAGHTVRALVQKGTPVPGSTRTFNVLDKPRINDAGQFAFSTNSLGTGSPSVFFLTGAAGASVTYAVRAAIGDAVPFIAGAVYSGGFQSTLLDNAGRWGFSTSINLTPGTTPAVTYPSVVFDGALKARAGDAATAPAMPPGVAEDMWSNFTLQRVFVGAGGDRLFWWGDVATGPRSAAALDNAVVVLQGRPLVMGGAPVGGFTSAWLEPHGDWFVRATLAEGSGTDNIDFVLRNGDAVAERYAPVTPGSALVWDRASTTSTFTGFLFNVGNRFGDYAIAGNARDTATEVRSGLVVLNGKRVVLRRGDGIDVNGNGVLDDDAVVSGIKSETGPGSAFLTHEGELWMNVDVASVGGADRGDAIIRVRAFCPSDFDRGGASDLLDIFGFLGAWFGGAPRADFNGAGGVELLDIFAFLNAWFGGC